MHGTISWTELATTDVEGAKRHYGAICGWTFEEVAMPGGAYHIAKLGDTMVAGIMHVDMIPYPVPSHWLAYLSVDDIAQACAQAVETGGKVVRPPFTVEGVGQIAIVTEPGGGTIGLVQSS